ncbi:MAG TPA: Gfo/Idh/MocA family oxidoreductase [Planctomycetaceae bacterium]|nr:Gfo/Idh/MocA family oxidoreductase [Planctomycetaceae bacterium]
MARKYRVGVIGHTGRGNYGHGLDTVWGHLPGCELVAVADADPTGLKATAARLKAPRAYSDYRKMLDEAKPDVISVGPRHLDQHRDMVIAAAERKIHLYMEKPMCRDLVEADEMVAACEKHKIKLAIAHQTRYSPKLRVIRDLIYDGQLGDVLELRGRGKEDRRGGGEDLWVLGSHVMNLIHHFAGEANWCFATVMEKDQPVTKQHVHQGPEGIGPLAGDNLAAMYGMNEGVTAYFGSQRDTAGRRFGLQIMGSKGIIDIVTGFLPQVNFLPDPMWSPGRSGKKWIPVSSAGAGKPEPLKDGGLHAGNIAACSDLLLAIEEDRQPECSVYEARTTVEMIAAIFESHRQGKPVSMPLKSRQNPLTLL